MKKVTLIQEKNWTTKYIWVVEWRQDTYEKMKDNLQEFEISDIDMEKIEKFGCLFEIVEWELVVSDNDEYLNYKKYEYQSKRLAEYPSIWDQLDAIWKWWQDMEDMKARVMEVKHKYPKSV